MKKLFTLLLLSMLLLSTQAKTVYYVNNDNWSDVYAYAFVDNNNRNAPYPGVLLSEGKQDLKIAGLTVYVFDAGDYPYVIFSDGGSGFGHETNTLSAVDGSYYYNSGSNSGTMYLRGTMNNWSSTAAMIPVYNDVWVIEVEIETGGEYEFKFCETNDWSGTDYSLNNVSINLNELTTVYTGLGQQNIKFTATNNTKYLFVFDKRNSSNKAMIATQYSVTYDANNATSGDIPTPKMDLAIDDYYHTYWTAIAAANSGSLARTHYVFDGWATGADGTGTSYAVGAGIDPTGENGITLYAKWTPVYSVTYDANGGSGAAPSDEAEYLEGASVTLKGAGTLSKDGYTFMGWNTSATGDGTHYAPTATITMGSENIVLYAQWDYTITYHFKYTGDGAGAYWSNTNAVHGYAFYHQDGHADSWIKTTWVGDILTENASHSGWFDYQVSYPTRNRVIFNDGHQAGGEGHQSGEIVIDGSKTELFVTYNGNLTESEVEITTNPEGYASFYGDATTIVPSGLKVYTATYNASASTVTLHEESTYESTGIPAHVGVFLKGNASANYTLEYNWASVSESANQNDLVGSVNATAKSGTKTTYVLSYQNSKTALYQYTGTGNIPAHKAYLELPLGAQAPSLRIIDGENNATSVENIETSEKVVKFFENGQLFVERNGVVYDMTGRIAK